MRDIYRNAVVSNVAVEELYERKLTADIDGANGLISLTNTRNDLVASEAETQKLTISFEQLRQLNRIMADLEHA